MPLGAPTSPIGSFIMVLRHLLGSSAPGLMRRSSVLSLIPFRRMTSAVLKTVEEWITAALHFGGDELFHFLQRGNG